ncbi:hypothetical protein [Parabacteroides sp. FAFU027]|uniref:hypothetical protein n=1 Tax=Parabacteroides sp. FAFU027 TaxID=2922715 RepID=UPI001FB01934|nr:hypothetical protein [Parabacteroides sp. FAFU027]
MKTLKSFSLRVLFAALILFFSGLGISESNTALARPPHGNPAWAPPYYNGVRYYYLPDIEAYYDLQREVFVYFRNGQWIFSASLPGIYANFDLNNGFVIALGSRVVNPWQNHKHYVESYPRYYYEKRYAPDRLREIRGYNENSRRPYFSPQGARKGNWKEIYKSERKQQKEYEKARKHEWKNEDKGNKHDNGEGRGNKRGWE